jgi:S1-C subfamily serine protease
VGELVLAIGNPFGVGQTVSSGIVSGLARSGTATGNARGYFIQTDAPINPGNSGGALVDVNGDLIGINTAILSRSGGSNGIGFAIPAGLVAQFVAQARAGKTEFERPWAGLGGQPVTPDMAEGLGIARPDGVVISEVHPQSSFAADIRPGDVITRVGGQPVNSPAEVIYRMSVAGIGSTTNVTRLRGGTEQEIEIAMIAAPDSPPRDPLETGPRAAIPQLTLVTINPVVIDQYRLPLMSEGAMVEDPGPFGARAGLRPGDILRAVNGVPVGTSRAATDALEEVMNTLSLDVLRDGRRMALRFRI